MHINKHKDMRFKLLESQYVKKLEIIGNEIGSLIVTLESTKDGAVTKEDIVKQLDEIKSFTNAI